MILANKFLQVLQNVNPSMKRLYYMFNFNNIEFNPYSELTIRMPILDGSAVLHMTALTDCTDVM